MVRVFTSIAGDRRLRVWLDPEQLNEPWTLRIERIEQEITCCAEQWCPNLNMWLDEVPADDVAEDDYCKSCPHTMVESPVQIRAWRGWFEHRPTTVAEARRAISAEMMTTWRGQNGYRSPRIKPLFEQPWIELEDAPPVPDPDVHSP